MCHATRNPHVALFQSLLEQHKCPPAHLADHSQTRSSLERTYKCRDACHQRALNRFLPQYTKDMEVWNNPPRSHQPCCATPDLVAAANFSSPLKFKSELYLRLAPPARPGVRPMLGERYRLTAPVPEPGPEPEPEPGDGPLLSPRRPSVADLSWPLEVQPALDDDVLLLSSSSSTVFFRAPHSKHVKNTQLWSTFIPLH